MKVYLVATEIDYEGVQLENAKVFTKMDDAIEYHKQLEELVGGVCDVFIKTMELN